MGREGVRNTHGTGERGKDLVFYAPSGMGELGLYAAVVKRDRIVGDITSNTSVRHVFNQAQEAFETPYTNPSTGAKERVRGVYVLCPHDCTQEAIDVIQDNLARLGTVEFRCGVRLMELFASHWKDFLLFESTVLVAYLSALRAGIQRDTALIELILRRSILAEVPREFTDMYVPQLFGHDWRYRGLAPAVREPLVLPRSDVRLADIRRLIDHLDLLTRVAEYLKACRSLDQSDLPLGEPGVATRGLSSSLESDWRSAYQEYAARTRKNYAAQFEDDRRSRDPSLRGRRTRADVAVPQVVSERAALLNVTWSASTYSWVTRAEEVRGWVVRVFDQECELIKRVASWNDPDAGHWALSREIVAACRLQDLAESVPGAIETDSRTLVRSVSCDAGILDNGPTILLFSGPAGFGKTSLCKWQSLRDAEDLLSRRGRVLPVYVPLSQFAFSLPSTMMDTLFRSQDLRELLNEPGRETTVRVYLDGLDEVPELSRQRSIVAFAQEAICTLPKVQVVLTARDHVLGSWLDGIPRLQMRPLDDAQQHALVHKWLGSDEATSLFFVQLANCASLCPLMRVPLLATLIAAVYKKQQYLPANRTALYALFVELLCGGWDAIKGVHRGASFGPHDKRMVLRQLALTNHLSGMRDATLGQFGKAIEAVLAAFSGQAEDLLAEILQDGLLVSTGAGVRFSHLSFQEYLAAEALLDPDGERPKVALREFFQGKNWWNEVLVFYLTQGCNPSAMEEWLIKRAREFARSARADIVLKGELDDRLSALRRALREGFPAYRSKYPDDGIVAEETRRRLGDSTILIKSRRTLSGRKLD